jgi:hypothetical protein
MYSAVERIRVTVLRFPRICAGVASGFHPGRLSESEDEDDQLPVLHGRSPRSAEDSVRRWAEKALLVNRRRWLFRAEDDPAPSPSYDLFE